MRLVADDLTLSRGERRLIEGLSLAVEASEALVLTGPNGVGKTTLLRALAGFIVPEAGAIRLEGGPDNGAAVGELAHYVGHANGVKPGLTVSENARFWARFLGGDVRAVEDVLEIIHLADIAEVPAAYLSAGQKRRLGLARLLLAHRPLWLLDEPTAALDVASQALLAGFMQRHLDAGGMLVAATHGPLGLAGARILELAAPAPGEVAAP
ncbi:MAG: heme ABC exporter, ATP-binding protein CcmA [Hyphomicrobium sp. SCN 65-11]|nr:MAG: heme ABC exporter, ATP-binding protein CcmA [Hyphomicrobium sp. SCN 65-11]